MDRKANPTLPYLVSRYLGYTVYLDELQQLDDRELSLLETEVHGIHSSCSQQLGRNLTHTGDLKLVETLLRTSGTFSYAIEREQVKRQRKVSILDLYQQLNAVRAECDALKEQLKAKKVVA